VVKCPGRISIGDDVQVFPRAWLSVVEEHLGSRYEPRLTIGNRVKLGHDLVIACIGEVVIEDDVLVSDRVFIGDTSHGFSDPDTPIHAQPMMPPRPVRIGRGAFLGVGSIVLGGVQVGPNGYVAAGAVVTKDVPARTVVAGNPATPIKAWNGRAWESQR
jgi:acetyltransferase-like isoleucine patch superfamily enzyme